MQGEMHADIVILTSLIEEYTAVCSLIPNLVRMRDDDQYAWMYGKIINLKTNVAYRIAIGMLGRSGNIISALATEKAILKWKPVCFFSTGIAGGIHSVKKGDIVVSEYIYDYEYGKIGKSFEPRHDMTFRASINLLKFAREYGLRNDWLKLVKSKLPGGMKPTVNFGGIASGNKIIEDIDGVFKQVFQNMPKLLAVEMEGAGIAQAIENARNIDLNVSFISIRGISDIPFKEHSAYKEERDNWKYYAAEIAAAFTVGLITEGLSIPPRSISNQVKFKSPQVEKNNIK
ncbi:MAG: hypothetical protein ACP5OU_06060, partial [Methanothrix sp.]